MPKPELEFIDPESIPWRAIDEKPGASEKILSYDPETGDYTRLLRVIGPSVGTQTLCHDFWEEVLLLKGSITDIVKNETYHAGYYACRPPGMKHGPYRTEGESLGYEIRYAKK